MSNVASFVGNDTLFFMTLQFSQNFSDSIFKANLSSLQNETIPACSVYDKESLSYQFCQGCEVSTYNDKNVTFACYDESMLCVTSSSYLSQISSNQITGMNVNSVTSETHELQQLLALGISDGIEDFSDNDSVLEIEENGKPNNINTRHLDTDDDNQSDVPNLNGFTSTKTVQTSLFGAVINTLTLTLNHNLLYFSSDQTKSAGALVTAVVLCLVVFSVYFIRWDRIDHDYIIYIKKDKMAMQLKEQWENRGSLLINQEDGSEMLTPRSSLERMSSMVPRIRNSKTKQVKSIIDIAMKSDFIFEVKSSFKLLKHALLYKHDYLCPWHGASLRKRRIIRFVRMFYALSVTVFVDTLFFNIFYPDNGYCDQISTKSSCISADKHATDSPTCIWKETKGSDGQYVYACQLNLPSLTFLFTVVLAFITICISLPLILSTDIILDEIATKRPNLEHIHLSTSFWFGSSTKVTTVKFPNNSNVEPSPSAIDDYHILPHYESNLFSASISLRPSATSYNFPVIDGLSDRFNEDSIKDFRKCAKLAYIDIQSVEEETATLLAQVLMYLKSACYILLSERDDKIRAEVRSTSEAIYRLLGIYLGMFHVVVSSSIYFTCTVYHMF